MLWVLKKRTENDDEAISILYSERNKRKNRHNFSTFCSFSINQTFFM